MKKEPKEVQAARIQGRSAILVAVISSLATCIIALLTIFFAFPPFQEWVRGWGSASKPQALSIEQIPQQIFSYADTSSGGWGAFWLIYDGDVTTYRFDYWLPADKSGYAGLAFQFLKSGNLSSYNAVECVMIFSQPPDVIDLYFKDIADNFNTIRVTGNSTTEMALRYEFKNFTNIDFNAVKEFGIVVNADFVTGGHQIRIKNVRFVK